jgi:hypothetical protein
MSNFKPEMDFYSTTSARPFPSSEMTRLSTHAKISHLVASLPPRSRQQVVFTLLVPSCQQVWNKLLTTYNNLVDIIRLVAGLFQYNHDVAMLLQPFCRQPCNILVLS